MVQKSECLSKTGPILSMCTIYALHITCICSTSFTLLMREGAVGFNKTPNNLLFVIVFMFLCLILLFFVSLPFSFRTKDGVLVGSYKNKWMKLSLFDSLRKRCPELILLISNKPLNWIKSIQKKDKEALHITACKDWKHWILYVSSGLLTNYSFLPQH